MPHIDWSLSAGLTPLLFMVVGSFLVAIAWDVSNRWAHRAGGRRNLTGILGQRVSGQGDRPTGMSSVP